MRGLVAVAAREINERRAALVAAIAAAVIPLVTPLLPNLSSLSPSEASSTAAWAIAIGYSWLLAASFGVSIVSSDLAEGRSGFDFSRPLGVLSIWFGRLAGSYLLVIAVQVVIIAPALLLPSSRSVLLDHASSQSTWFIVELTVIVPLMLLLAAHTVAVMWRVRSAWSLGDLAALLLLAGWLWLALGPFARYSRMTFRAGVTLAALEFLIVLAGACAIHVAVGGGDLRRGRGVLSVALWAGMMVVAITVTGWSMWVRAVEPDDLVKLGSGASASPDGRWIRVEGWGRGRFDYQGKFLLNTTSGRYIRLDKGGYPYPSFDLDKRRAWWVEPSSEHTVRLVVADLKDDDLVDIGAVIHFDASSRIRAVHFSDEGELVAVHDGRTVSVFDLSSGDLRMMAGFKSVDKDLTIWFASDDVVRVLSAPGSETPGVESAVRISEMDLRNRTVRAIGRIPPADHTPPELESRQKHTVPEVMLTPNRDRLLVSQRVGESWRSTLRDSRTGELVNELQVGHIGWNFHVLSDGRMIKLETLPTDNRIRLFTIDGDPAGEVSIGPGRTLTYGGEVDPGLITVGMDVVGEGYLKGWVARAVDLNNLTVRDIAAGGGPDESHPGCPAGAGNLFYDTNSTLVLWDPQTDTTRRVLDARLWRW